MFQKSTHRATSPGQFKNGPNYVALVLSFVPLIIALFAPVDRGTHIYLVIWAQKMAASMKMEFIAIYCFSLCVFSLGSALSKYHIHCGMQERPTS